MERVFLDANVLWSAAFKEFSTLRRLWALPGIALMTSEYAAEEARRNLEGPGICDSSGRELRDKLELLLGQITMVSTPYPLPDDLRVDLPAKDIPILAAALSADADYLITGDKRHFGAYFGRKVHKLTVLRPVEYLDRSD